jgi:7,8-dihydropterin-6-yl-methyl-4-(beta-D-ribofuranosyl)aminobenzene 5'-phosphate synthase
MRSRYALREGGPKEIGIPLPSRDALEALPPSRLHPVERPVMLLQEVGLTGPIPRETDYEDPGGPFYLDPQGRQKDPIEDDLALWIQTGQGVVVCAGCSHAGIINTLCYVKRLTGGSRIRAVIGGFHLLNADARRLEQTVKALRALNPDMVVPCHCTGEEAVRVLQESLGEMVSPGAAGTSYSFE